MAGDVSLIIEDAGLGRLIRGMSGRAVAGKAALASARREEANTLLEDLRVATPYRTEDDDPHARDGWAEEPRGEDTAIVNRVDHIWYLLHGNSPNGPDGLIHPVQAQVLHFYDGGTEVFAHGVRPMHADPGLVGAWDRASHDAEGMARRVVERAAADLRAGLR